MGRVDNEIQKDLVQGTHMAEHGRQVAELGDDFSHVFVFVPGDSEGGLQSLVQVRKGLFPLVRM